MGKHKRGYTSAKSTNIRWKFITYGIIAAIAIGIGYASYSVISSPQPSIGPIGSAHDHIALGIYVNGEPLDFSDGKYQVQSRLAHLEGGNGNTVHKHATGVKLGFFLDTIGIGFNDTCLSVDDGRQFCDQEDKTLKFYVNGAKSELHDQYLLGNNDKVLISYGNEDEEQIREQIDVVQSLQIKP